MTQINTEHFMLNRRISSLLGIGLMVLTAVVMPGRADAGYQITFGPQETNITGSIKYSVIGQYRSQFDQFKGEIILDPETHQIGSVYLEIEAETIGSSCGWCDKIVRSKQLLHTDKYPKIIFKSNEIMRDENGYRVKGILDMHGIQKEVIFPFESDMIKGSDEAGALFSVSGKWTIQRKDFDIVWNRILDKGGILVGNNIIVDWGIQTEMKNF